MSFVHYIHTSPPGHSKKIREAQGFLYSQFSPSKSKMVIQFLYGKFENLEKGQMDEVLVSISKKWCPVLAQILKARAFIVVDLEVSF